MKWHRLLVMVVALSSGAYAHAEEVEGATELHARPKARPPLLSVEAEAGVGVALGSGSNGPTVVRLAPISMHLVLDYAIIQQPWVSVWGGIQAEALGRAGVGGVVGLRVRPIKEQPLRIGAGVATILFPYTIGGIDAHVGVCPKFARVFRGCVDADVTAWLFGGDLPPSRVTTQLSLMLGGAFDVL
jgi:hypothetical protein